MDKIKAFFQKKKVDAKFKMAGSGHTLSSSSKTTLSPSKQAPRQQQVRRSPDKHTKEIQESAAQAALKRLEVTSSKQNVSRSSQAIKLQAKKALEAEEHNVDKSDSQQHPMGPECKEFDAAPVLAVNGVFFTCELLGDDLYLTKDDMCDAVEAFLNDTFEEDPIVSSSIMIHSLNANHYRREACVEVLTKYIDNLIQSPEEEKFRKIRKSNKIFVEKVSDIKGSLQFLKAIGFEETEENGEAYLIIPPESCTAERLVQAKECLVNGQPMPLKLFRNPLLITHAAQPLADLGLPRDFFERSAPEIKAEQHEKAQEVEKMLMLRTREMRERDEIKRVYKYRFTLLRIRFPDGFMLQGTFRSSENIEAVESFVRENIECDWVPFMLKDVRGEAFKGVKREKTLAELLLAPAAVLHFELEPDLVKDYAAAGQPLPNNYLKRELLESAE